MTKQELITTAKQRVTEIAKATKVCPDGKQTEIYESDNGVMVSHIQKGWTTRTQALNFGSDPMTPREVLKEIQRAEALEKQLIQ